MLAKCCTWQRMSCWKPSDGEQTRKYGYPLIQHSSSHQVIPTTASELNLWQLSAHHWSAWAAVPSGFLRAKSVSLC